MAKLVELYRRIHISMQNKILGILLKQGQLKTVVSSTKILNWIYQQEICIIDNFSIT